MTTLDEITSEFDKSASALSLLFIKLCALIELEEGKKASGEEYNERIVTNGNQIKMHAAHALGEMVESKSFLFTEDELSIPDKLCKAQYEAEMNEALDAYVKAHSFTDILNDD